MRFDRARATETIERIARLENKDESAELELAQLIKAWLDQSGWDVESREVLGSASAAAVQRSLAYLTYGLTAAAVLLLDAGWVLEFLEFSCLRARCRGLVAAFDKFAQASLVAAALATRQALDCKETFVRPRIAPRGHPGLTGPGRPPGQDISPFRWFISTRPDSGLPIAGSRCCWNWHEAGPAIPHRAWRRSSPLSAAQSLDQAGDWALAELLAKEWPRKPRLLLTLNAPGIGKELLIHDDGRLVLDAAESLWVPYRLPIFRESRRVPRLPLRVAESEVWLGGSATDDGPQVVDLEALARAAQLVEEVVLRWGKRHSGLTDRSAGGRANRLQVVPEPGISLGDAAGIEDRDSGPFRPARANDMAMRWSS